LDPGGAAMHGIDSATGVAGALALAGGEDPRVEVHRGIDDGVRVPFRRRRAISEVSVGRDHDRHSGGTSGLHIALVVAHVKRAGGLDS
jgi:hypothetical protein